MTGPLHEQWITQRLSKGEIPTASRTLEPNWEPAYPRDTRFEVKNEEQSNKIDNLTTQKLVQKLEKWVPKKIKARERRKTIQVRIEKA